MRVFHFVIVKRKRALRSNSFFFFFNDSHIFLKYFNSNHNLSSYSLFSKCFLWLFYFGVHRGTGVFSWFFFFFFFFTPPLASGSLSRSPRTCLRSTEKRWKTAPVLQIQASLMKGFMVSSFLSSFISKRMVKTNFFLQPHQHSDKEVFLGVSRE